MYCVERLYTPHTRAVGGAPPRRCCTRDKKVNEKYRNYKIASINELFDLHFSLTKGGSTRVLLAFFTEPFRY